MHGVVDRVTEELAAQADDGDTVAADTSRTDTSWDDVQAATTADPGSATRLGGEAPTADRS